MTDENQNSGSETANSGQESEQTQGQSSEFTIDQMASLLKSNSDSQDFIKTLKTENQQYRDKINELEQNLNTSKSMQELMEELRGTTIDTGSPDSNSPQLDKGELLAELKQELQSTLEQQRAQEQQEANLGQALQAVQQKHGDGYEAYMQNRAGELGMSREQLVQMAATAPKAFVDLMSTGTPGTPGITTPSIRSPQSDPVDQAELDYAKVARLKNDLNSEEGRAAHKLWSDPDWQAAQRQRIIEKARTEGSQYGNTIR